MGFLEPIPSIILVFAALLLVVAPIAFLAGRRGGRFRGLRRWTGFWAFFAVLLVCLSRAHLWVAFPVLGLFMFAGLRQYFFTSPVRPQDRWAIVLSFLLVPLALWPAFLGRAAVFDAFIPLAILLLVPVLLSSSSAKQGLLDSLGRVVLGATVFVYCGSFLGLMAHGAEGRLELFGILALLAEFPQRLLGRLRSTELLARSFPGVFLGVVLAGAAGWLLGPWAEIPALRGAAAGAFVALATSGGALVATSVAEDLDMSASAAVIGRAAFLDRTIPAVFAAPVYFHWLAAVA